MTNRTDVGASGFEPAEPVEALVTVITSGFQSEETVSVNPGTIGTKTLCQIQMSVVSGRVAQGA